MDDFFEEFLGFNPNGLLTHGDDKGLLQLRNAVEAFEHVCNEDFYIIDCVRRGIIYMTRNLSDFLNISNTQSSTSLMKSFYSCVPTLDIGNYKEALTLFPTIYNRLPISERKSLVLSGNYHLTNGHKQLLVFERATPLYIDADGKLRLILFTVTGSSTQQAGEILITKGRGTATMFYSFKDKYWHCLQVGHLNDREHMVLNLAARGYTTEGISMLLRIGIDSIKKCRKDILKKTGATNLAQAIRASYNLMSV